MLVDDVIKIRYSKAGYLPNYPPTLISDSEMFDAFLPYHLDDSWEAFLSGCKSGDIVSYFWDNYPLMSDSLESYYKDLVQAIAYHIDKVVQDNLEVYRVPDWVYSYMLGATLSVNSDKLDIHDLLVFLNVDNLDDIFTVAACKGCLSISTQWISKLDPNSLDHRPPTIFGEPHVLKYVRLNSIL